MYYAIEIVGYGKRQRFVIKKVIGSTTYPFNYACYTTEENARRGAKQAGIEIKCIGDLWQIINKGDK